MMVGPGDGRWDRGEAEAMFGHAVAHCEKGEWNEALKLVDQAIELDRQRRYVERRAVILEQLGRREEAIAARREAAGIADQIMLSHLEEVLELRSDGDRALEQLKESSFAARKAEASERRADTSMRTTSDHAMLSKLDPPRIEHFRLDTLLRGFENGDAPQRPTDVQNRSSSPPDKRRSKFAGVLLSFLKRLRFWRARRPS